jgi:hypothetical protein
VISSLVQDGVARASDVAWMRRKRRFVVVLNRFRWEDAAAAEREGRPYERVRTALAVDDVTAVRAKGLKPGDRESVLALLALAFEPGEDGAGRIFLTCAEGVTFAIEAETLEVTLADLTRPWQARAERAPDHGETG